MSRQERRKQRTTDAILDAAERSFDEVGYAASTIEAIAERADVAIGSIYTRFGGKEGLYLALVERLVEANARHISAALSSDGGPRQRVLAAEAAYLDFHREHRGAFRLIGLRDLEHGGADGGHVAARERIAEQLREMLTELAAVIDEAVTAGEMRTVDSTAAATFLWASWNGAVALRLRGLITDAGLEATLRTGSDITHRGLRHDA